MQTESINTQVHLIYESNKCFPAEIKQTEKLQLILQDIYNRISFTFFFVIFIKFFRVSLSFSSAMRNKFSVFLVYKKFFFLSFHNLFPLILIRIQNEERRKIKMNRKVLLNPLWKALLEVEEVIEFIISCEIAYFDWYFLCFFENKSTGF